MFVGFIFYGNVWESLVPVSKLYKMYGVWCVGVTHRWLFVGELRVHSISGLS